MKFKQECAESPLDIGAEPKIVSKPHPLHPVFFKYGNLQYRLMVKFKILPEVVLIWIHFRTLPTLLCFGKPSDPISIRNDTYTNTCAFRNKRSKDNIEHDQHFWFCRICPPCLFLPTAADVWSDVSVKHNPTTA